MKISGKYSKDQNFIDVYTDNAVYTIARVTGEWAKREVGELLNTGHKLTPEILNKWASECERSGNFELKEGQNEN